ncbi:MAG: glycosyltransferase family 4 protein [Planctomycetes bacterium]|nr:glycosyltransferase family 4 protein [Planctomycetota bacterium]
MRILLVTAGFLPDGLGGVELSLARFCKWAQRQGHEVLVYRRFDVEAEPDYARHEAVVDGIPVVGINYRFRDATTFQHLVENPAQRAAFDEVCAGFRPDVVHVHHATCLTTEVVEASQARGVPVVFSLHDYWMGCPRGQRIRADLSYCPTIEPARCIGCYRETWPHWFPKEPDRTFDQRTFGDYQARIRETLERADALIAPSPFARRVFAREGIAAERIEVIEYGMDVDAYRGVARTPASHFRIGFLGTLLPSKGVHLLIDAFQRIGSADLSLELHGPIVPFHQDRTYGERLHAQAAGWEEQITFHGAYRPEQTPRLLAGLDALVVPSIWYETYCMVIREGFLAGVPVVASNFGAMAESIDDGTTGLLFGMGDSVDIGRKLLRLARDRELQQRLVASEKHVSTTEENGASTVAVYERAQRGRRRA